MKEMSAPELTTIAGPLGLALCEASVHLPHRGRIWVAVFTGPTGGQVWRTTGQTDRAKALALAKRWEARARAQRVKLGHKVTKPVLRVGPSKLQTTARGPFSQKEVGILLNLSERAVREIERRAFDKLRSHPLLRQLWDQYLSEELHEKHWTLTPMEIDALFGLAKSQEEYWLLLKLVHLTQH